MPDDLIDRLKSLRQNWLEPFPAFRRYRDTQPVAQTGPNAWAVFRYDDVARVLSSAIP
jgi:cytochrome P450